VNLRRFPFILLGLAAGACTLQAAPGVALALDAAWLDGGHYIGLDENTGTCEIRAASPHVTVLHLDADRSWHDQEAEVDRFFHEVQPWLPEMIRRALAAAGLPGHKVIYFEDGTYTPDLFNSPGRPLKGYRPGPKSAAAFKALNRELNEFFEGRWQPGDGDGKAPFKPSRMFKGIHVTGTTAVQNYAPHLSVNGPSVHHGAATAVQTLSVDLAQGLTLRWHR